MQPKILLRLTVILLTATVSFPVVAIAAPSKQTQPDASATVVDKPVTAASKDLESLTRRVIQGVASWYGPGFHGRRSASGERFNQNAMTAAHRSLPFGTRVRVTNLNNGSSVEVRINDRGPFTRGRIIDLSKGAAQAIGLMRSGVAPVEVEVIQ